MIPHPAALAAALALSLMIAPAAARDAAKTNPAHALTSLTGNGEAPPLPTVDRNGIGIYIVGAVVLGIGVPSPVLVGTTGEDGRFSGRVRVERGEYQVTAACSPGRACTPFRLSSVRVDGRALAPDARGRFAFPGRPEGRSVMLEATVVGQEGSIPRDRAVPQPPRT